MTGLSIYSDGLPLLDPPHLTPCSGSATTPLPLDSPSASTSSSTSTAETEAELRRLFHQISGGFLKHSSGDLVSEILGFGLLPGSPTVCIDHSQLLDHWIQKLCSAREDRRVPLCPDLNRRIKQLIGKLLNERIAGLEDDHAMSSGNSSSGGRTRNCNPLKDMLMNLRGVAADPFGQMSPAAVVQQRKEEILRARQAFFVNMADVPNMEDFPYRKKHKTNQSLHGASTAYLYLERPHMEQSGKSGSEILQPTRRSKRTFGLLKLNESFLPRKRIPCGDDFQAVVPQWTGPVQREVLEVDENLDDSKCQGTLIWPIEVDDRENSENIIGKGRPQSCSCNSSGSVDCIRFHVSTSRLHLKSELGQAFFDWEFDKMGEDVSQLWTDEEQLMFDDLLKLNPASKGMSFWKPALEYFTSKSSQDIASYYFNVHVLRRIIKQTRSGSGTVDSSEEEGNASDNAHDD